MALRTCLLGQLTHLSSKQIDGSNKSHAHHSYAPFCVLYSNISASCPGVKCLKYVQFSSVKRKKIVDATGNQLQVESNTQEERQTDAETDATVMFELF